MFQDLDSTLTKILKAPPAPAELKNADNSFQTPDQTFSPANPTLNLFLYETKENRDLRDPVPIVERSGTTFVRRPPPIRIDCSYIVTTWSPAVGDARVAEEHLLIAQAILWLSHFPTIPPAFLQGTLANQPFPMPMYVAQLDPNKNAGEFWDALHIPPRPAFYLTVTIAMDLTVFNEGFLVTTRSIRTIPSTDKADHDWVQIGGQVHGPAVTAVRAQAALVSSTGNQAIVTSAANAANFRIGDIVLLQEGATPTREIATVADVNSATIIFTANLANTYTNNGTIRIADLAPGRRVIRLTNVLGLQADAYISVSQAGHVEETTIHSVDRTSNTITLSRPLLGSFTMETLAAPVNFVPVIVGALLDIVDLEQRSYTGSDGRYSFLRVPSGTHSLRTTAVGYQPKAQALVVPGFPDDYNVNLTPL